MRPEKTPINIDFSQGLDTKTDEKQIPIGKFLVLRNKVFNKDKLLQKRNGFGTLPKLPNTTYSYVSTLNDNLTAVGPTIAALSSGSDSWVSKGSIAPMEVSTLPLIRNSLNQSQADSAVSSNGLVCTAYSEQNAGTTTIKYVIADSVTGQNITSPQEIPVSSGTPTGSPKVFVVQNYFVIVFTNLVSATSHLQFISISISNTSVVTLAQDIAAAYVSATSVSWDAVVVSDQLYVAWNTTTGGQAVDITYLSYANIVSGQAPTTPTTFASSKATVVSLCADLFNPLAPIIYINTYDLSTTTGQSMAVDNNLVVVMSPTTIIPSGTFLNLASTASNGVCTIFGEVSNNYGYDSTIPSHYIDAVTITLPATVTTGTVGSPYVVVRSVGLASKAFVINGVIYFLAAYQSAYQSSYFLINASLSTAANPIVSAKLAYSNGGGYLPTGISSVSVNGSTAQFAYLYKDFIAAQNIITAAPIAGQSLGVYTQTGINLATIEIDSNQIVSSEMAGSLYISGGFGWMYDGYFPVENNFFLWPDSVELAPAASGGGMLAQEYFYAATYEWSDNQGNIHRSASSIEVSTTVVAGSGLTFDSVFSSGVSSITVSSATGLFVGQQITDTSTSGNIQANTYITSIVGLVVGLSLPTAGNSTTTPGDVLQTVDQGEVVVNIPYLRLTYKTANPAKIVLYRWSVAQPVFYQVTSLTSAQLNLTTSDSLAYTDKVNDFAITGNSILYTVGGVVENVNGPASNIITSFDNRIWVLDAEDKNLWWYSKQVIENVPVEMSDLLTYYIAPSSGAQGPTGVVTSGAPMDDKLISFKKNAIYYTNGTGPDNTGANSQYSQPIFVTSTVGCANQNSIVLLPNGLMFQSDKGIWLLGRDLSTQYIGAPVQGYTEGAIVNSAINIPGTNQVRFTLNTGTTLMYDYYYGQWGTFVGVPGISSCVYQGLHTFINSYGAVFQETPGVFLDGATPVLMGFTTGWINLAGLQGYERIYDFYLLAQYISPHFLTVQVAYDYGPITQQSIIQPNNYTGNYGSDQTYAQTTPYGGPGDLEMWRVHTDRQTCMAFQITVQEQFNPFFGTVAGEGFTMSGLNLTVGVKKGRRPVPASNSVG